MILWYLGLDRIYVEETIFSIVNLDVHALVSVSPSSLFNHHPIYAKKIMDSYLGNKRKVKSGFKLNTSLLNNDKDNGTIHMVSSLCNICNSKLKPKDRWSLLVDSWEKIYRNIAKKRARDRDEEE